MNRLQWNAVIEELIAQTKHLKTVLIIDDGSFFNRKLELSDWLEEQRKAKT